MSTYTSDLTSSTSLRPYQLDGVGAIREAFGEEKRICYVLPTGGGKTVVFSYITAQAKAKGTRTVIVGHTVEIVEQISLALTAMGIEHGLIVAGSTPSDHLIQVGMVQSIANRLSKIPAPTLLVLDECHHAVAGTWQKLLAAWKDAYVLGVTATPERLDGRGLREAGFERLVFGPDVAELIEMGHLAKFRYLGAKVNVNFDDVHTIGGDYAADEVEARMATRSVVGDVVKHYQDHLSGRTCIAFCVTVRHAEMVAQAYRDAGIPAASLDGSMKSEERREVVRKLRDGEIMVLTSCAVISEGFDAPSVGGAQLLRPTQSFSMFRQQIGRCLRPKADGSPAVILDHVGNFERHGLPDEAHVWDLDSEKRTAKKAKEVKPSTRVCKNCLTVFPASFKQAPCEPFEGIVVPNCLFATKVLEVNATGTLGEVMRDNWASQDDIKFANYFTIVRRAVGNPIRLQQIALARGFKRGWVYHQQEEFRSRTGPVWGAEAGKRRP